jgi:peroxiredoxin Q/BCP
MTMFKITKFSAAAMLLGAPICLAQAQTSPMVGMKMAPAAEMLAAPAVGDIAPDFTATGASMSGTHNVSLKALRGQVVVLAFYPLDRSGGCTHELTKFRDEFSTIFGSGATVLPISEDSVESHVGWARDAKFPFTLVSDAKGEIAGHYGSMMPDRPYANRTIFVIGKDGKVTYRDMKFGALDQHAYDGLTAAVAKAKAE